MLFKDFKLVSGLVKDLEYEAEDNIELLSQQQHDVIYQLITENYESDLDIWSMELVELMRMLILSPSVEEICSKWLKLTGNEKIFNICKNLGISVDFQSYWLNTDDQQIIEHKGLLFRMKELRLPWNTSTLALNGHLDCLKYAHEQGCPWDCVTTINAAENGHLDCLMYAHEQGCPWDVDATANAAEKGHLDCLKYLHENGCPWDIWTSAYAASKGHLDCLK